MAQAELQPPILDPTDAQGVSLHGHVVELLSPVEEIRQEIDHIGELLSENERDIHECVDEIGRIAKELVERALDSGDEAVTAQEHYNQRHAQLVDRRDGLVVLREQLLARLTVLEKELGNIVRRR